MKNRNKNNISQIFKIITIILLICIPIYILYFDNLIHKSESLNQSLTLKESLTLNQSLTLKESLTLNQPLSLKESFNNYVNVCGSKVPNFYDIQGSASKTYTIDPTGHGCSHYCDDTSNCNMYIINDNNCKIYTDLSDQGFSAKVNCNTKQLPGSANYTYAGQGYVNNNYYKDHKSEFTHIDYLLDKANDIKASYMEIQNNIDNLEYDDTTRKTIIDGLYDSINNNLTGLSSYLDISFDKMYSLLIPKSELYNTNNTSMNFFGNDISFSPFLKKFYKLEKEGEYADAKLENDSLEFNRRSLVYTILLFIMIITILLLILYKFVPDLISDGKMFIYFVGIMLLIFFIQTFLKQ